MAYCRNDGVESDLYVMQTFAEKDGESALICMGCPLKHNQLMNRKEMLSHFEKHEKVGHRIPEYAWKRLLEEIDDGSGKDMPWREARR